ncbi:MAG: GNAT family N-acetyltransferase [Oscillospiraceae bacterium]|nr:GNAT family N-acetyltransferase [Oscillospiraceae bacterium]
MFYDTQDLRNQEIYLHLRRTAPAQPDKKWLPAYFFDICLLSGEIVGSCDLRIGHNENTYIGGNIGYEVLRAFRGNHYAAKACKLLFRQARKHGMDHLIITCDPNNIASARTCELAGGILLEIADIPEDNELYSDGKTKVNIYRFDIG